MYRCLVLPLSVLMLTACASINQPAMNAEIASAQQKIIATVDTVTGTPRVLRGNRYLEVGEKSALLAGDTLVAGQAEALTVRLNDKTRLTLTSDTQLVLNVASWPDKPAALKLVLLQGRVLVETGGLSKRNDSVIVVNTPVAQIGLAGSGVLLGLSRDGTVLDVLQPGQGAVIVQNDFGEARLIRPGDAVTTSFGEAPGAISHLQVHVITDALATMQRSLN